MASACGCSGSCQMKLLFCPSLDDGSKDVQSHWPYNNKATVIPKTRKISVEPQLPILVKVEHVPEARMILWNLRMSKANPSAFSAVDRMLRMATYPTKYLRKSLKVRCGTPNGGGIDLKTKIRLGNQQRQHTRMLGLAKLRSESILPRIRVGAYRSFPSYTRWPSQHSSPGCEYQCQQPTFRRHKAASSRRDMHGFQPRSNDFTAIVPSAQHASSPC